MLRSTRPWIAIGMDCDVPQERDRTKGVSMKYYCIVLMSIMAVGLTVSEQEPENEEQQENTRKALNISADKTDKSCERGRQEVWRSAHVSR